MKSKLSVRVGQVNTADSLRDKRFQAVIYCDRTSVGMGYGPTVEKAEEKALADARRFSKKLSAAMETVATARALDKARKRS